MKPSIAAALLATVLGSAAWAEAPLSAEEIARRALESTLLFADQARAEVELQVSRDQAPVRSRRLLAYVRREGQRARSYVEFLAPGDVAGTRFLSIPGEDGNPEQYIYLPAYRKVKRVVGAQKAQSFVGTDFSFADLEGRTARDWVWTSRPEQELEGTPVHVVEGRSREGAVGYQRIVVWVHRQQLVPLRTEMYGADPTRPEKLFRVLKLAPLEGRLVVKEATMETLSARTLTRLVVTSLDVKSPIADERFTKEALER